MARGRWAPPVTKNPPTWPDAKPTPPPVGVGAEHTWHKTCTVPDGMVVPALTQFAVFLTGGNSLSERKSCGSPSEMLLPFGLLRMPYS